MPSESSENINIHTRIQALVFRSKAALLQLKRGAENLFDKKLSKFSPGESLEQKPLIAESKTALWTESRAEEQFLLAGKVQNLPAAIKNLDGLEIPAGEIFSFWKQVGRASRRRGFVEGRELREGCVIPNVGGGLCQLSNALYDAALKAGFEIVERHAHTQVIAGSLAEQDRDATVFWNYVDLRFRSPAAFRIEAKLGRDHLSVKLKGDKRELIQIANLKKNKLSAHPSENQPNSCAACGVESCFRSLKTEDTHPDFGKTAYLVDEFAPEFNEYLQKSKSEKDLLFIPLDGRRYKKSNYAWDTKGFGGVRQSFLTTLIRSYRSRKLAAQGAARQKSLLAMAEKLAESYAKNLSHDVLHVVVSQNLLPLLWKNGHLGGRTFDVLMNALPMDELQKRLDYARSLHPESPTLGDFRAEPRMLEAEREALQNAVRIITPHAEIASLFGERSLLLDWKKPAAAQKSGARRKAGKFTVVFPASTVGRKGCYELREAIRGFDVRLVTLGAVIEDAAFWDGFDWEKGAAGGDWLDRADLVVLPAFVEHKPRRLLQAAALRIPVIASFACGLKNSAGVTNIEAGNVAALRAEIDSAMRSSAKSNLQPEELTAASELQY